MKQLYFYIILFCSLLMVTPIATQAQGGQDGDQLVPKGVDGMDESTGALVANYTQMAKQKEEELGKLVSMYKKADPTDQSQIRQQVEAVLNQLFEINVKKREAEIKALEMEIQDVEKGIEFRKINKEQIVGKKLRELLDE